MRYCATSQNVAVSILHGVIGIFRLCNPSGRTRIDEAAKRKEYQSYLLGGKGGGSVRLKTLPPSCNECLAALVASNSWGPKGLYRDICTFCIVHGETDEQEDGGHWVSRQSATNSDK